jgi:shikimate kinase
MKSRRGIYLVGFSGTGKSTVARLIGETLQWPVCDLDELIVERSGLSIPEIFQREGEAGFRLREAEALRLASNDHPFVIATGGGTVVRTENRVYMASKGWIICLDGQPETLLARIQAQMSDGNAGAIRPMLHAVDRLDKIRSLKQNRQAAYDLSDWTIHTDRLTPAQSAAEVIRAVELLENSKEPDNS